MKASLSKLETHLTEQKAYIIKELSLADIVTWCTLYILLAPEGGMLGGIYNRPICYVLLNYRPIAQV